MNPHQKNKIDINSLSPDEQRLFRLYGKLPSKSDHLAKHLKERKYFDSGDYALQKAGKADSVDTGSVGSKHPLPENIPHLSSPVAGNPAQGGSGNGNALTPGGTLLPSGSPVKESSFLNRETSVDEVEKENAGVGANSSAQDGEENNQQPPISPPLMREGIPIRK